MKNVPKRKIKDSVFKSLFENKKYLLQLYQALHPEDHATTEEDIRDVTIHPVLVDSEYNDLGFSVGDRLITLVESQSTWSPNIIIRALMYLISTYHDYFKRTHQSLYSTKKAHMPSPELYVIYTGEDKVPDKITLRDEFFGGKKGSMDAEVKVLSNGEDPTIIGEYIAFARIYDKQRKDHGQTEKAIKNAIEICKDRNILKEFLKAHETEVITMEMSLFNEEYIWKAYGRDQRHEGKEEGKREGKEEGKREGIKEGIKEGRKEGIEEGELKAARKFARELFTLGTVSADKIAQMTGLPIEEVEAIASGMKTEG